MITRAGAAALDANDPLAARRERFDLPVGLIYLDGNSLGALPRSVGAATAVLLGEWRTQLIAGWDGGWWEAPVVVGDKVAALLGAAAGQVVVCDSTSVNLYKLLVAATRLRPDGRRIVTAAGNFPTDRYLIGEVARQHDLDVIVVPVPELEAALEPGLAVLTLTHVDYRTGERHDLARLTRAAHDAGGLVLWDLSHSVGAVPLSLDDDDVDLAVGCSYKYLNGGPGAPGWCYVAACHQEALDSPLPGWVGHQDPFAMADDYRPARGIRRLLVGTPPLVAMRALDAALDEFDGVMMPVLREKSLALTDLFITLVDDRLTDLGFRVLTPREHERRGSQVSLVHRDAEILVDELVAHGVVADHRPPDVLRFGFTPLYVRFVDVWDAVDRLVQVAKARVPRSVSSGRP